MVKLLLLISILVSFLSSLITIPFWIRKAKQIKLEWKDMNKLGSKKIPGAGGVTVVFGFILGVLFYIAINTFYFKSIDNIVEILALTTSILIVSGIGIIDDLLGWQHGGLSKKNRLIILFFAAVPLMVINAGVHTVSIPFIYQFDIGLLYPLIVIPIGIVGATATFNFLAGYNGLEAGQGILILSSLAIFSWLNGTNWLSLIIICMVVSLMAFMFYNKYPSKIFPGDVLTYPIGCLIAIIAILGNMELFTVFIFIPYIIEAGLKLRGKLEKQSFGIPEKDGSIKMPYEKIYGLEHLAIFLIKKFKKNGKAYEIEVTLAIYLFQASIILIGFLLLT